MSLPPDWVEMLSVFENAGVRYLVIGGPAVPLHARTRTTKDLDRWLDAAPENIGRACAALLRFGVPEALVGAARRDRLDGADPRPRRLPANRIRAHLRCRV